MLRPAVLGPSLLAGLAVGSAVALVAALLADGRRRAGPGWWSPLARHLGHAIRGVAARARVRQRPVDAAALAVVVEGVGRAARTGASLPQALRLAAGTAPPPWSADLATVCGLLDAGASVRAALGGWAAARPSPGVRLAVAALVLAHEQGGDLGAAAEAAAGDVRAAVAAQAEVAAQSVQARASAVVVAAAPVAFSALLTGTDRRVRSVVLHSPVGWACLGAGTALVALGAWWMHRLVGEARSWAG